MENMTTEELRERAALIKQMREDLEAIAELSAPKDEEMQAVSGYRADLESLEDLAPWVPSEEEIQKVSGYRGNLEALEDLAPLVPSEAEIKDAASHLATLKAIEEAAEATHQ